VKRIFKVLSTLLLLLASGFAQTNFLIEKPQPHKFWDKKNVALQGFSFTAATLDMVTTRLLLDRKSEAPFFNVGREQNPLARPFTNKGWKGSLALNGILSTGILSGSYWLHKRGHHKLERWLPFVAGMMSTGAAVNNIVLRSQKHYEVRK
jgi:hypothetical protein